MKGAKLRNAFRPLVERIETELRAAAHEGLDSEAKRDVVVERVVRFVDDKTHWPNTPAGMMAELIDGPIIRILVAAVVHEVADRIDAGEAS